MEIMPGELADTLIVKPVRHIDARGYFCETFRADEFDRAVGHHVEFVQENESMSSRGVVRGLHFQTGEHAQAKLVRVSQGRIVDVVVDLRRESPTFGRHMCIELSSDNGIMLFVPRGFAHGFAVMSDMARFQYKVDNYYCPEAERTLRFDDPVIGIQWPFDKADMILSPRDLNGVGWDRIETF
ncbi:MAG: dTDP-4-dehydrorhamnose 3,5-epimerase [Muribaculaceae bacterium]|nr:dTDP-4-dehydrorhamnose 3,5-epimerase [Muribaculaceae bacterium]